MIKKLHSLLEPKSIAIVGASLNPQKPGGRAINYLLEYGFPGKIIPINPNRNEIAGLPCIKDISDIEKVPDLVIIAVAASEVAKTLQKCIDLAVPAVNIYSSGFAEVGLSGAQMQDELLSQIKSSDTLVCGPNSQGVANFHHPMVAYFSSELGLEERPAGPIGFVGHSGVMGGIVARECIDRGIGIGYLVSLGNEIDVSLSDVISHMSMNTNISAIGAYVETVRDPLSLKDAIYFAQSRNVTVVILKGGKNEVASKAAASHTAAMVGDWETHVSALRQWGAVVVDNMEELIDSIELFGLCKNLPNGSKVGVLTNSGGIGVLCADALVSSGLEIAELSSETEEAILETLPPFASPKNPIDVTLQWLTQPEQIRKQLELVAADPNVDIIMPFPGVIRQHANVLKSEIITASRKLNKPIICGWFGGDDADRVSLREAGISVYDSPTRASRMAAMLTNIEKKNYSENFYQSKIQIMKIKEFIEGKKGQLSEFHSKQILEKVGVPMTSYGHAINKNEVVELGQKIGFPVVLKISSKDILHKTDVSGVTLGITSTLDLENEYELMLKNVSEKIPGVNIEGFFVEKMLSPGVEVIIGMKRDENYGPVIALGSGGILVEVLNDKALLIPPFSRDDVTRCINKLHLNKLLSGFRGQKTLNKECLVDAVCILGDLALSSYEIIEFEINPIVILENGCYALDAKIKLND